jgi:hypothetical protein
VGWPTAGSCLLERALVWGPPGDLDLARYAPLGTCTVVWATSCSRADDDGRRGETYVHDVLLTLPHRYFELPTRQTVRPLQRARLPESGAHGSTMP